MKLLLALASSSLLLYSAALFAQTNDPEARPNPYSVARCSFAATVVAGMAMTYPDDQEKRKAGIDAVASTPIQGNRDSFPTHSEFQTARIVMEYVLKGWAGDQPHLKDKIIADAAATCMLVAFLDSRPSA